MHKHLTTTDKLINIFDDLLRNFTKTEVTSFTARSNPSHQFADTELTEQEKKQCAGLMRVNHAGEIAAQALYKGQALVARDVYVAARMKESADEEQDHLVWCSQRLKELDSHTSYLDPVWFVGSLAIGVAAGIAGDRWSLGFIAETEKQVVNHLNSHLEILPVKDQRSRAILEQMREDEQHHGNMAIECGASMLPGFIKGFMRFPAKIMTVTAYYL